MRADIAKVVVERPRNGLTGARCAARIRRRKNNDPRFFEDAPRVQSMAGWNYYEHKHQTDFLSPLEGFIRKSIGRLWDDVYSEMREFLSPNSTLQKHIFEHVWDFVTKDVVLNDDGVPCTREREGLRGKKGGWKLVPLGSYSWRRGRHGTFIHPVSGLLLAVPDLRPPKAPQPVRPRGWKALGSGDYTTEYIVQGKDVYAKYNGVWFHVDMRPVPKDGGWGANVVRRLVRVDPITNKDVFDVDYGPSDVLLGVRLRVEHRNDGIRWIGREDGSGRRLQARQFYGSLGYYAHKIGHQLNTKMLRRLGVVNDPIITETPFTKREREKRHFNYVFTRRRGRL